VAEDRDCGLVGAGHDAVDAVAVGEGTTHPDAGGAGRAESATVGEGLWGGAGVHEGKCIRSLARGRSTSSKDGAGNMVRRAR